MNVLIGARTHFSLGESTLSTKEVVDQAVKAGYTAVAIADTMTVSSSIEFAQAAKKAGIKGILGCRLRVVRDPLYRPPSKKSGEVILPNPEFYPKVYARTEEGFRRIMRLLSLGFSASHFYKVPRIGIADLLSELGTDDLTITTGDQWGLWTTPGAVEIAKKIIAVHRADHFYSELVAANTPHFARLTLVAATHARALGMPMILTRPALYDEGKSESLEVLGAIIGRSTMTDGWTKLPHLKDFFIKPMAPDILREALEVVERLKTSYAFDAKGLFPQALGGLDTFEASIGYEWKKLSPSMPKMAEDEYAELVRQCQAGFGVRFAETVWGHMPTNAEKGTVYLERLKFELATLKKMGFSGYFLLVADLVRWAKSQGILVGPGRGSVGGSLVAYLMGITDVDPIRFDLLFERFINPDRLDLPDADLDFMSARRQDVIAYLVAKYGEENVAGVSNYGVMQAASALRDAARVFGINVSAIAASKLVPKEHGKPVSLDEAAAAVPELDRLRLSEPVLWATAQGLEGVMRSYGRHAAGVIVAGEPITRRAVVETRSDSRTVNWDKRIVEDMGLIKMDILGLTTLDVFELALRMIFKRHGKRLDLIRLPLDDVKVLEAFGKGQTLGVFQFESGGMRKLLKELAENAPLTFDDITAATALYRPGPMDSGLMTDYVSIKQGVGTPFYEHPNMRKALEPTGSVLVYQEQVMQLARDLAGMTFTEADHLRKAMGKKDKALMAEQRDKWTAGCISHSAMDPSRAAALFDKIEKFAGYGFNKSHAVEYALISYTGMWLKVNYPLEFYAAALSVMKEDALAPLVKDMGTRGIVLSPPDINHSTAIFEALDERTLLSPFNRIKGISDNCTDAILLARETGKFKDKADFIARVNRTKCNKGHQEKLDKVGAFARIEPGQPAAMDPIRLRDQQESLPGLILTVARVARSIDLNETLALGIKALVVECKACGKCDLAGGVHPSPRMGKRPKFMVVSAYPAWSEEQEGKMMMGMSVDPIKTALQAAGLSIEDGYWTAMVKSPKPKDATYLTNDQINACTPYLERELALVKPPVIIALGSPVARYFVKDLKGGIEEHNAKAVFDKGRDVNIICGISAGSVGMAPGKQELLNDVFRKAAELVI